MTSANATYALGQADLVSGTPAGGQNGIDDGFGLAYDGDDNLLFVADANLNRVMVFNVATITTGMNAVHVLGQTNFSLGGTALTQSGLSSPQGVAYDGTDHLLFVSDFTNNRVLAFSTTSISDGMNAVHVLGQADYVTGTLHTTQNGIYGPMGLTYDPASRMLFVAEQQNRRVTAFNIANLSDNMNATYELGQADFVSRTLLDTQSGMTTPEGVAYDSVNHLLYVTDNFNNRILAFNTLNATNGENAKAVLGQSDFVSGGSGLSQTALHSPFGVAFDAANNRLYAADYTNNRILTYNFVKMTTASLANATKGTSYSQSLASQNAQGTVTYAVTSGSLPAGLTLSTAGVLSGTPTATGTFNFEITATDTFGSAGSFMQDPAFSITVNPAAPNTGFGASLSNPLRTLSIYAVAAVALFAAAIGLRKLARRDQA